jgi:hypothetical protein
MFQAENCWMDLDEVWYEFYAIGGHPKLLCFNGNNDNHDNDSNSTNHSNDSNQNSHSNEFIFRKCTYVPMQIFLETNMLSVSYNQQYY